MNIDIGLRYLARGWMGWMRSDLRPDGRCGGRRRFRARNSGSGRITRPHMTDGVTIDVPLVQATIPVVLDRIKQGTRGRDGLPPASLPAAGKLFDQMTAAKPTSRISNLDCLRVDRLIRMIRTGLPIFHCSLRSGAPSFALFAKDPGFPTPRPQPWSRVRLSIRKKAA